MIKKIKVNFKFYDATWLANNCNTHIAQYSRCLILFLVFTCNNFPFRALLDFRIIGLQVLLNLVAPLDSSVPSLDFEQINVFGLPVLIPLVLYLIRSVLAEVYLNCISRIRFKCSFFWPWENQHMVHGFDSISITQFPLWFVQFQLKVP